MEVNMKSVFFIFLLYTITYAKGFALPFEGLYRLDIIHYNDFHARFEETSVESPTCRFNNNSCLGGFPRLYYEITHLLKRKPEAILLNAGDSFQGTYWYTLLKWNITQQFMNMLPHDAHAIGNHEFDDGPEGLAPYLRHLKAPILAANIDVSQEPSMQGIIVPSIIVTRKGRKIGIIGLITTETKSLSSPGNVTFTDPGEATRREAQALADQNVDIIILLSHCGLAVDKQLAQDYGENIDIIVGGHSHSLLWNGEAPSGEEVAGPYPVFVLNSKKKKRKVLIVQASAFTKYMGDLSVFFDFRGDFVKWEGGPIFLNRSIPEDEDIKKKLAPFAEIVHKAENVAIGESKTELNSDDCVFGECTLGNLLVDAIRNNAITKRKSDYDYVSAIQRGNIRSSIEEGTVTRGEIFELLPFNDRIIVFEIAGKYILQALERSVSEEWSLSPFKGPWLLQVSGLRVTYNVSMPQGERVTSVTTDKGPMTDDQLYVMSVPSYLGDGGDGFTMLKEGRQNVEVIGRDEAVLEDYVQAHSPLDIKKDGRITINY